MTTERIEIKKNVSNICTDLFYFILSFSVPKKRNEIQRNKNEQKWSRKNLTENINNKYT